MREQGEQPVVPGHVPVRRLGLSTWQAREQAGGADVVLRVLRGLPSDALLRVRRAAAELADLGLPHLLPVRRVVAAGPDVVVVLPRAGGGSLARLVRRRRVLRPGEVVTVGVPLAETLDALHAHGHVHGAVAARSVLLDGDGRPLLDPPPLERPEHAGPEDDVRALAALCRDLLGPGPHAGEAAAVAGVLDGVLGAPPGSGTGAAALGLALRGAATVEPLDLGGRGPSGAPAVPPQSAPPSSLPRWPGAGRHRRRSAAGRRGLLHARAVLAAGLLSLSALVGWALGRGDAGSAAPLPLVASRAPAVAAATASPVPVASAPLPSRSARPARAAAAVASPRQPPDWAVVLDRLDAARAAAFEAGDPSALLAVAAPGSPALAADRALLQALVAQERTARGVRHVVRSVRELSYDGASARLHVRDVLGPHDLLAADGHVVERRPGRGEAEAEARLVLTPDGWRLHALHPS